MKSVKLILALSILTICSYASFAQPPGGRMSPEDRVKREKQNLYKNIDDLSEDQTMIIDDIYDEFAVTLDETFQEVRKSGNREEMRPKMEALMAEKDELLKDILNEDQWLIYVEMDEAQRKRMEENREQRTNNGTPQ